MCLSTRVYSTVVIMKIKKFIYDLIQAGNIGFILILYLAFILVILWPPSVAINELFLKKLFFYLVFPLGTFSFVGIILMISNLISNRYIQQRSDDINDRLWLRIILSSWSYGAALYYNQVFRKIYFQEENLKSRHTFLERVIKRIKVNKLSLDILFTIIIGSLSLFLLTWLIFLFSPIFKPEFFKTFWIYPLKLFPVFGLSWLTLYWIAIADRSQRTDEELRKIDPFFIDFPYILNIGKGLFKYYRKVLRPVRPSVNYEKEK